MSANEKVESANGFRQIIICTKEDEVESITLTFRTKNKPFTKPKTNSVTWTKGTEDIRLIVEDKPMWGKPIVVEK